MSSDETPRGPGPRPAAVVRAVAVVSGGPLALWLGGVVGPEALLRGWPRRGSTARRAVSATAWAAALAPWLHVALVRPRLLTWGSTAEEQATAYPGDVERPWFTTTRAVTVRAPPSEVWRWLVQVGQDRGGFYSYDWLENLAGCRLHSADRIHPEWQHREVGDPLTVFPGYATTIGAVDPPRSLLIDNWGAYVVRPTGPHTCRLIARSHAERNVGGLAYVAFVELPHAVMERRMLLGIKERAERNAARGPGPQPSAPNASYTM
ncbi:hypothetical protein [Nocardioides daphniae]|uniref:SRPBCC family protein n=1 Tax=Nocardioides daphniae TaxID=402297 RepID=A0ABQ1QIA5_9ACTN|nr:hypothetical protein [Nocardioides daphniae]GGD26889.1 hypothetical protein GCM10007231_27880 [Nocardioides daphniae]